MSHEEDERKIYNSRMYEAKQSGIEEGSINKSIEIAKKMLEEKIPIETIMKITTLSKEEIEKL